MFMCPWTLDKEPFPQVWSTNQYEDIKISLKKKKKNTQKNVEDYRDGRVDITGKERACAENKPTNEFESQRCICKWINMHQPHNGINKTILNFMHNNAAPDLQFSQF